MKEKSVRLGAVALAVIITSVGAVSFTMAQTPNSWFNKGQAIKDAIEKSDYSAFQEAVKMPDPMEQLTQEQFNKLAEANKLREAGKIDEAKAIMEELDLPMMMGHGFGDREGFGKGRFDSEKMDAINAAIEANDYNAWLEAVGPDSPMAQKITAETFPKIVEIHKLRQAGDFQGAENLEEESGLEMPMRGFGQGMHVGNRNK